MYKEAAYGPEVKHRALCPAAHSCPIVERSGARHGSVQAQRVTNECQAPDHALEVIVPGLLVGEHLDGRLVVL